MFGYLNDPVQKYEKLTGALMCMEHSKKWWSKDSTSYTEVQNKLNKFKSIWEKNSNKSSEQSDADLDPQKKNAKKELLIACTDYIRSHTSLFGRWTSTGKNRLESVRVIRTLLLSGYWEPLILDEQTEKLIEPPEDYVLTEEEKNVLSNTNGISSNEEYEIFRSAIHKKFYNSSSPSSVQNQFIPKVNKRLSSLRGEQNVKNAAFQYSQIMKIFFQQNDFIIHISEQLFFDNFVKNHSISNAHGKLSSKKLTDKLKYSNNNIILILKKDKLLDTTTFTLNPFLPGSFPETGITEPNIPLGLLTLALSCESLENTVWFGTINGNYSTPENSLLKTLQLNFNQKISINHIDHIIFPSVYDSTKKLIEFCEESNIHYITCN